jgi:hypothetical protein
MNMLQASPLEIERLKRRQARSLEPANVGAGRRRLHTR